MEVATAVVLLILLSIFGLQASNGDLEIGSLTDGKYFENCLVVTENQQTDLLDYSSFSNPVGKGSGNCGPGRTPNLLSSPPFYSGKLKKQHKSSDQLRYLRCILTLVMWRPLGEDTMAAISGWFSCSYCAKSKQYTPFYCPDLSQCSESMATAYEDATEGGMGVEWRTTKGRLRVLHKFITLSPCPLTLGQHGDCIQNEPQTLIHFCLMD